MADPTVERATATAYLLFGIVEALVAIRLVVRVVGADAHAGFAQFTYGLSAPVAGLFADPQSGGSVLELHSIVALIVYALAAWVLGEVVGLLFGETRSAVTTASTSVEALS